MNILPAFPSEQFVYLDRTDHNEGTNAYSNVPSASWVSSAVLIRGADEDEEKALCAIQVERVMVNLRRQPTDLMLHQIIEDGKLHMDVRMQLLAQQVLLVYKTGHTYIDLKSRWRICHKLEPKVAGDEAQSCYQAAHCNLFPELGLKVPALNQYIHFPKTSWLCSTWNTTTLLTSAWNKTDTMLDGQNSKRSSFRAQVTEVLNRAAQITAGSCVEYYNEVITKIATHVEKCMRRYQPPHQYAGPLRCYREVLEQYLIRVRAGENMLAWACMEQSLERAETIRVVQMRIWKMSQTKAASFLASERRFSPDAWLYQPMQLHQNLLKVPMRQLQIPEPVQRIGAAPQPLRHAAQVMQRVSQAPHIVPPIQRVMVQAFAAPVVSISQPPMVHFRYPEELEKKGMQYKDHCLQDQEIQSIARRHWQAGGVSTAAFAPMKARIKVLIKERFGVQAPQHQDKIATCIFAQLYAPVTV